MSGGSCDVDKNIPEVSVDTGCVPSLTYTRKQTLSRAVNNLRGRAQQPQIRGWRRPRM